MVGIVGEGQGDGTSTLMKDRSGYLLISMSAMLSGEDDGTKPSGLSHSDESWSLRGKTHKEDK